MRFKKLISGLVMIAFLTSNAAWAGVQDVSFKLAAPTLALSIQDAALSQYIDRTILNVLLRHDISRSGSLRDQLGEVNTEVASALTSLTGIDASFSYGIVANEQNNDAWAFYRILKRSGVPAALIRYSKQNQPADPLYERFLGDCKKGKAGELVIGESVFIPEIILVPEDLRPFIASLKFPGEYPEQGSGKSIAGGIILPETALVYQNCPDNNNERRAVETQIEQYRTNNQITDIQAELDRIINDQTYICAREKIGKRKSLTVEEEQILDTFNKLIWIKGITKSIRKGMERDGEFQSDINIKVNLVPDLIIETTGGKRRVFPAYTMREDAEGKIIYTIYLSCRFVAEMNRYKTNKAVAMLIMHELSEIKGMSHEEAERREFDLGSFDINGRRMSYLDGFIHYVYAEELGSDKQEWWDELKRCIIFEKLRLIIESGFRDKADHIDGMKDEFFSLYPGFSDLEKLTIPIKKGEQIETITLWEYILNVCESLEDFIFERCKAYPEIGESNFKRMRNYASDIITNSELRELLFLSILLFQTGRIGDTSLGGYYSVGKKIAKKFLEEYYRRTGHVAPERRERLVTLGGELIYRFGDIRAMWTGDRSLANLLKIKEVKNLTDSDKGTLLKLLNIFTVIYSRNRLSGSLKDAFVDYIYDKVFDLTKLEVLYRDQERVRTDRLRIWMGTDEVISMFWSYVNEGIKKPSEMGKFKAFINEINFYNAHRVIQDLLKDAKDPSQSDEHKRLCIKRFANILFFMMKLRESAMEANPGLEKDWIMFPDDTVAEDLAGRLGEFELSRINDYFEQDKEYIRGNFRENNREAVLLGIPVYAQANRIIIDIHREDNAPGLMHGVKSMQRRLRAAVEHTNGSFEGEYYDMLVVVTDEFSAQPMMELVREAQNEGFIPVRAKVAVVVQPKDKIKSNWSAIINLMCNPNLKVIDQEGVQLVEDKSATQGMRLGEYIKGGNIGVVLSAGAAKRNFPMTAHGGADKGKMDSINAYPYLFQTFMQVMQYFKPGRKGMVITANDGIRAIANELIFGRRGFQIIGARKPATVFGQYNRELAELGCIKVDISGNVLRFVEKPETKEEYEEKIGVDPLVPTNWADYFLRPDFLIALAEAFGNLRDEDGQLIYVKYGLDTSMDFSEPCTISEDEYIISKKEKKKWPESVSKKVHQAVNGLKDRFGIGFVDAGVKAFFKDTGTVLTFRDAALELLINEDLRELLGITEENGFRIVRDERGQMKHIFGPNVRIGEGVILGKKTVILGNVLIEKGMIGDECVILDTVVEEINLGSKNMLYGVYMPGQKLEFTKENCLITDVFLEKDHPVYGRRLKLQMPETYLVKFPDGYKAYKITMVLPIDSKANDVTSEYSIVLTGDKIERGIYVRNSVVVGVVEQDWTGVDTKLVINKKIEIDQNEKLLWVEGRNKKREIGIFKRLRAGGSEVWDMNIWPRNPALDGAHPRVKELDASKNKFTMKELSECLDTQAEGRFRKLLAGMGDSGSPLYKPDSMFKDPTRKRVSKGYLGLTAEDHDEFLKPECAILNMTPGLGIESKVEIGTEAFNVRLEVNLGNLNRNKAAVEVWYGIPGHTDWQAVELNYIKTINGKFIYEGQIPLPKDFPGDSLKLEFMSRIKLKGTDRVKWFSRELGHNSAIVIKKFFTAPASLLPRVVNDSEPTEFIWQAGLKEDGGIDRAKFQILKEGHSKLQQIDLEKYERVRQRLIKRYEGAGIFGAVSGIRVVDNLRSRQGDKIAPYAIVDIDRETGVRWILVDVDAFKESDDAFYLILDHELKHSILELITADGALEELAAIYMSLQEALTSEIAGPGNLDELGRDNRFWILLNRLKAIPAEKRTDELIVAAAIEYMRRMPYYDKLFSQLKLNTGEWLSKVSAIGEDLDAALEVYGQLAETEDVRRITGKVKKLAQDEEKVRTNLTRVVGIEVEENIAKAIKKVKMVVSRLPVVESDFAEALFAQKKYIKLDVDELSRQGNEHIVNWLKELLGKKRISLSQSPFLFYSRSNNTALVKSFLEKNGFVQGVLPASFNRDCVIDLVDPVNVSNQLKTDTLYLPLPYSVSSIYLAGQVVLSKGKFSEISDILARNTIRSLYETLMDRTLTDEILDDLFRTPWTVLPPIEQITATLDSLRTAIVKIEVAA